MDNYDCIPDIITCWINSYNNYCTDPRCKIVGAKHEQECSVKYFLTCDGIDSSVWKISLEVPSITWGEGNRWFCENINFNVYSKYSTNFGWDICGLGTHRVSTTMVFTVKENGIKGISVSPSDISIRRAFDILYAIVTKPFVMLYFDITNCNPLYTRKIPSSRGMVKYTKKWLREQNRECRAVSKGKYKLARILKRNLEKCVVEEALKHGIKYLDNFDCSGIENTRIEIIDTECFVPLADSQYELYVVSDTLVRANNLLDETEGKDLFTYKLTDKHEKWIKLWVKMYTKIHKCPLHFDSQFAIVSEERFKIISDNVEDQKKRRNNTNWVEIPVRR